MSGRGFPFGDKITALLLTDSAAEDVAAAALARACADRGVCAYVSPWHAVRVEPGHVFLAGGQVFEGPGARPLELWTGVAPRMVLPVASMEIEGMASTYRRIADACPEALLTWTPELADWSGRTRTEVLLRHAPGAVQRPVTALLPDERERVAELGGTEVVLREASSIRARGAQVVADAPSALALLEAHRGATEVLASSKLAADFDLRVFGLIKSVDPVRVVLAHEGLARGWPEGWARTTPLPSLNGRVPRPSGIPRPMALRGSDLLSEEGWAALEGVVAAYARSLSVAVRLGDLPRRHRVLPWLTVDVLVSGTGQDSTLVALLDVDLSFGSRTHDGLTAAAVGPVLDELVARCGESRSVVLPEPDLDVVSADRPASIGHPRIAPLLPQIGAEPSLVHTVAWPGASFTYLDPRMRLADGADLLTALGRVIGTEPGPTQPRFVEPGVGRTCLVDGVVVDGLPDLVDASVLGIGLTPFSDRGYAMVGPHVDGLTSMLRAEMRRATAERLAAAGCRTALTTAIVELPGLSTTMPDFSHERAALVVRAFRCVLRVKQLDPLATPYLSPQHRPLLWEFLTDPRWETTGQPGSLMLAPGRLGGTVRSQRQIADSSADPHVSAEAGRRREVIALYAPLLVRFAAGRLAVELGRDPRTDPVSTREYVEWFATQVGAALAVMRRERFLHDYHQPDVGRADPNLAYSLGESNVSLLAEFVDFDTGLFCDATDELTVEALRLRRADVERLRSDYPRWHARDQAEARSVVRTLTTLACHGQRSVVAAALRLFDQAYEGH